jgi:cytochrome c551/c552
VLRARLALALAIAGMSAQAVFAEPAASPPQEQAADAAYIDAMFAHQACLLAHAKSADDHISTPTVIAAKFKDACRAEEDRFIAGMKGYVARHPGRIEAPPDHFSEHDRLGAAEAFVVEARKSNSAAGDGSH